MGCRVWSNRREQSKQTKKIIAAGGIGSSRTVELLDGVNNNWRAGNVHVYLRWFFFASECLQKLTFIQFTERGDVLIMNRVNPSVVSLNPNLPQRKRSYKITVQAQINC